MKKEKPLPNRYIVALDDDVIPDDLPLEARREQVTAIANSHAQTHGGTADFIYENGLKGYAIELPNEAAARAISNLPQVQWVEEDSLGEWDQAAPNPQPSPPWGLDSVDSGLPVPAPSFTTGRNNGSFNWGPDGTAVAAYVLDSGINTGHQEFMTPFFSRAVLAADCFNFVNCVSGTQTSFFNQQQCVFPVPNAGNNDCLGHGTHVAGTIGGNTYGVAKNISIRSVKVGSSFGPVESAVLKGVDWVTGNHQANPLTPAVANMSLQIGPGQMLEEKVQNCINQGVTVVVAAGNNNANANVGAPANVEDALVVGAVDWNGVRSPVSNWGPLVDLFAPGVQVVSASTGTICNGGNSPSAFCLLSGTSHAAPHVAGVVAMYLQNRFGQTNCNTFPINGPAPPSANFSTCPDRVARFVNANARRDQLSNINGTIFVNGVPVTVFSPNRFVTNANFGGPANPNDNNPFFLWSQYKDFLNREPDSGGYSNWIAVLNACSASDWPCLNAARIHTVRGFIESGEFRNGKPALSNPTSTAQYNEEYVRQLYFCLLHRFPDTDGMSNWLSFLNSTNDYSHVVHGFINSTEYRRRFGPP